MSHHQLTSQAVNPRAESLVDKLRGAGCMSQTMCGSCTEEKKMPERLTNRQMNAGWDVSREKAGTMAMKLKEERCACGKGGKVSLFS